MDITGVFAMPLRHISCAPANEGEILARNYLQRALEYTDGVLLTNYHHPFYNASLEHDLVLINRLGVWVIEVKNWHSLIKADQSKWLRTGDDLSIDSPISTTENKAKHLKTTLSNAGFQNISVVAMVVLTQPEDIAPIEFYNEPRQYTQFFRLQPRLIDALTERGPVNYRFSPDNIFLSNKMMQDIADMLVTRKVDQAASIVGDYLLLDKLEQGEMFISYKAKHRTMPGRYARVKKYHMADITSSEALRQATERFKHDMRALQYLGRHPHIVHVETYFVDEDSEDIHWMIVEWINGETLQHQMNRKKTFSLDEQLHILRAVADALDRCHTNKILHRNLTPSSIYIDEFDGTVKMGDFDYARVPGANLTISIPGKPLTVNKYTPEELITDGRNADARSDLFSLGAIWYEMAISPDPEERIQFFRIEQAALPDKAIQLLSKLVEPRRSDRPKDAATVKKWLQNL
jgi:hypothetical protein